MSISSLPVAKFEFPWAPEEECDPRDRRQIAALTAALQASLARESVSRQQRRTFTASTYTGA
jgi:hypothetical protein